MAHIHIRHSDNKTHTQDNIHIPSMSCPTDQVLHTECMTDAMDSVSVKIGTHPFHHECIIDTLDVHAEGAHQCAMDAVAEHDGHASGLAIGFTDPQANGMLSH